MPKNQAITALDLGSSQIKLLMAAFKDESSDFDIVFRAEEPSLGIRRGVVIDVDKVSRIIQILIDRARVETGQKISSVFINIGGSHIKSALSRGMIAVSRADRRISKEDINRVLEEASKAVPLASNNEILEIFPKDFIIDGVSGIKSAEDLQGSRLETEILVLSSFLPYKNNLVQAVLEADLQILDIIPSVMAGSSVVLTERQKELGAAVLDIGAGTSELAVFREGGLIHLSVFPIGSANITSDIAVGLKTDIDVAEAIKLKLGTCFFKGKDKKETVEIEGGERLVFSRRTLTKIIEARVSEIFGEVQKEMKIILKHNLIPAGLVLIGGGAKLPQINELAKKDLKLPSRPGRINYFTELADEPDWATPGGLIFQAAFSEENDSRRSSLNMPANFFEKTKKVLKNFLP